MDSDRTRHIIVPPSCGGDSADDLCNEESRTVRITESNNDPQAQLHSDALEDAGGVHSLYSIKAKVGGGGMGVVYLAVDNKLGRFVALKRLNAQANANTALRRRFLNEARAVASLNNIHIVHIYSLGEDEEGPYIAMEYVPGPAATTGSRQLDGGSDMPHAPLSLDKHVAENGQYTVNEAVDLIVKLTKAIAYAHSNGVIHRDIKPSNILLDETGEPKIVDFGLARLLCEAESQLTVPGEKLLSLGYGAPEQESDASVSDERADIYGLGGLLYFAITGQNPRYFREQDIPVSLREVLCKALATDREQRWPTAQDFLDALLAVQSRTRIEQPPSKITWRCKWCDTLNPISIRFCSECGWDGLEECPECDAENFIGMQFCGKCGADMRVYESMRELITKIQTALDDDEYEKAVLLSSRAQGFEPAGPAGRAIDKEIRQLREHAQKQIDRRQQLKNIIPLELRAENFERAATFIEEYRRISGNNQFYIDEYARIKENIVRRDLKRARKAYDERKWNFALELCRKILRHTDKDNADCIAFKKRIQRRLAISRTLRTAGLFLVFILIYILSLPIVGALTNCKSLPANIARIFMPARKIYGSDRFYGKPFRVVADLLCAEKMGEMFSVLEESTSPQSAGTNMPESVNSLLSDYKRSVASAASKLQIYKSSWRQPYLDELKELEKSKKNAGDYVPMRCVEHERVQFETSGNISADKQDDPKELREIKMRYRRDMMAVKVESARSVIATTKKYINDLDSLVRDFTKNGDLQIAEFLYDERLRAESSEQLKDAEKTIAQSDVAGVTDAQSVTTLRSSDNIEDLKVIQLRYDKALEEIETQYAVELNEWPQKYNKALTVLRDHFQQSLKTDGWIATMDEIDRFGLYQTLSEENITAGDPIEKLAELQRDYIDMRSRYSQKRAAAIISLATRTQAELQELLARMMRENNINAAKAVNAEIQRNNSLPEVRGARAELAR